MGPTQVNHFPAGEVSPVRRVARLLASAAVVVVAVLVPVSAASAATRWVNDDKPVGSNTSCNKPGHNTIQSAVDVSAAGDHIRVCQGTYNESVSVPAGKDNLTLTSAGGVIDGSGQAAGSPGVKVQSNNVTVQGFVVRNTQGPGIQYGTDYTTACTAGVGTTGGAVRFNLVRDTFRGPGPGGLAAGKTGIEFCNSSGATIEFNAVLESGRRGINLDKTTADLAVEGFKVRYNAVIGSRGGGVRIRNVNGNTVEHNFASDCEERAGFPLRNADGNTVRDNRVERCENRNPTEVGAGGIDVDAASTDNTLLDNEMEDNVGQMVLGVFVPFDAADRSTGTGTAGSANTWQENECDVDSPDGLCEPPDA
jgi:parallel beta-helix repeat protein